jgi:hypothetical protein
LGGLYSGYQEVAQESSRDQETRSVQIEQGALLEDELVLVAYLGCLVNPITHACQGTHGYLAIGTLRRLGSP